MLCHEKPGCFESRTTVVSCGKDEHGNYIVVQNTLFYPQGGGQPSDQGCVIFEGISIPIHAVKTKDGEIRHYSKDEIPEIAGKEVDLKVDSEKRQMHSRLHSAGHVISHAVEEIYPDCRAVKGHHFPGECYVEFSGDRELDLDAINGKIAQFIEANYEVNSSYVSGADLPQVCPNLSYSVPAHDQIRLIRIGHYDRQPCCGTHVSELSELRRLHITKQKVKGKSIKLTYEICRI